MFGNGSSEAANVAAPPRRIVHPSKRRDKPILSCTLCRQRKAKCDRQSPCKTCIDRGLSHSCVYTQDNLNLSKPKISTPDGGSSQTHAYKPHTSAIYKSKPYDSVYHRIDLLEKLVSRLMERQTGLGVSPNQNELDSFLDQQSDGSGGETLETPEFVKQSSDSTSYTNSSHWISLLDAISELREQLDQIPIEAANQQPTSDGSSGPDLLFGRRNHATKQEIIAALPSRAEADLLIRIYFSSLDTSACILHESTFWGEYTRFWQQPFETSTMWLGLLYALLALGSHFQATMNRQGTNLEEFPTHFLYRARQDLYRQKVAQCLILANYTKCPPYTIETMLLYFATEYVRSVDTQFGCWILVGIIVRISLRMGLHREPSKFSNITPFRAEMRRRAWLVIMSLDLASSFQVGLPRMIQASACNTREPLNVLESDIRENMVELPQPRLELELTPLLYTIIRMRINELYAKVMDLTNATAQPPYQDVIELDKAIQQIYDRLPEHFKFTSNKDFEDPATLELMRRLTLSLFLLKTKVSLHRPYLLLGRTSPRYSHSRRTCLNSALQMLDLQKRIDKEIRPGGRFANFGWQFIHVSWYVSSIVAHDFLLATAVLVLDLESDQKEALSPDESLGAHSSQVGELPSHTTIVEALRSAYETWSTASMKSLEVRKVTRAVKYILEKEARRNNDRIDISDPPVAGSTFTDTPGTEFNFDDFTREASSSQYLGAYHNGYPCPFPFDDFPMGPGYSEMMNEQQALRGDL